ncbi:MAG: peptidylprolyl isomerase [Christensenellales bacterium]
MKKTILVLLLSLMMTLSSFTALAQEQPAPAQDPVLATVNGIEITKSQVQKQIPVFLNSQYIADASDYRSVLDVMIRREVLLKKVRDMGFDRFSPQEEESFAAEAEKQWQDALNYYADYYQSEDTQQAREEALKQAETLFANEGVNYELVLADVRDAASMDRMKDYLLAGYTPSEEEIQKTFLEIGAMYEKSFANEIAQYEYMTQFAGQSSWYTPEGYRGVIHILLTPDEALMETYRNLSARFEEQKQTDEVPLEDSAPETSDTHTAQQEPEVSQQMVDEARQAVMDSRKAEIDLIYNRLQRGESFVDLVREYGEDPGMTNEDNLANGYAVHRQSIIYDPVFTAAAFADNMQKPGDVSQPVLGSYGIHIVQYLRDVPSGLIMTDTIRQEIEDYLLAIKQNEVFTTAYASWQTQEEIVYFQDVIDQVTAEAVQMLQSPEELPLEALPGIEEENHDDSPPLTP